MRKEIIKNPGGFASLFDLKKLKYKDPILLSSSDGVGTKLKLAIELNRLDFLGFDLVAMCVNDLLSNGGNQFFFLDYIASSKIKKNVFLDLILSINSACAEAGCSLVGGETAEMPGFYKKDEFDIAGFSVGVVERENLLYKNKVKSNSIIIGLESSGFHSNGFSLIRKVLKSKKISLKGKVPYKSNFKTIGMDLIQPTKIYVQTVLPLIKKKLVSSISHITGGGIYENLERIIPEKHCGIINSKSFKIPERFLWLQKLANINIKEMLRTFNCGIGLILIIEQKNLKNVSVFFNKKKIKFHELGKLIKVRSKNQKVKIEKFGEWDLT